MKLFSYSLLILLLNTMFIPLSYVSGHGSQGDEQGTSATGLSLSLEAILGIMLLLTIILASIFVYLLKIQDKQMLLKMVIFAWSFLILDYLAYRYIIIPGR